MRKRWKACFSSDEEWLVFVSRVKETYLIVVACVDVTAHAEVCDLDGESCPHQTITTRQVTVYKALSCQVLHPSSDLQSY
jgi:hypothetical protein